MFTAASFIIAKMWKPLKCLSVYDWTQKTWCTVCGTQTQHDSATEKKKSLSLSTTLMDLDGIMLSEISQTKKEKYHMISLKCKVYTQAHENTSSRKQNRLRLRVEVRGESWVNCFGIFFFLI